MFRRGNKPGRLIFSSLLAGACLSAFAIFGWGVEYSAVTKALVVIFLVFMAISIPAAGILVICKGSAFAIRKIREKNE